MELRIVFVLFLISLSVSTETRAQDICQVPSFPPLSGADGGGFSPGTQYIIPTMNFTGCGVITDWTIVGVGGGRNGNNRGRIIELQLFRPDPTRSTVFTEVTSSVVTTTLPLNELSTHTFTAIGFTFSPGDVLGFYNPNTGNDIFEVRRTTSFSTHSVLSANSPTASVVTLTATVTSVPLMSVSVSCTECPRSTTILPTSSEPVEPSSSLNPTGPTSSSTAMSTSSTDPANSGDLSTEAASVMDNNPSSQPPTSTTTAEISPEGTPSSQPPASINTAEMSSEATTSSQPSASINTAETSPEATPFSQPSASINTAETSPEATTSSQPSASINTAETSPEATTSSQPSASINTAETSPEATTSSQPSASINTAETSPEATPFSQPSASINTAEMSPEATPSSQPSSSTIAPPPVTEEVGSGPPVAAIGGAVGAVVVLAIIGVIFLIVVGVVCVVRKKKYTVNKPALYDMPPDAYCTFGSGQPMVPSNGDYEMTEINGPMDYDDVITNKSALQYETPQSNLKTSCDSKEYDNIQDLQSLSNDVRDRNDRLYSDITITNSQTVPQADTSDHEYQEADEISPEEVHQPPSVQDNTLSGPVYGHVPTMNQRRKMNSLEITASASFSNPGYVGGVAQSYTLPVNTVNSTVESLYETSANEPEIYWEPGTQEEEIYAQMAQWGYQEIPRASVTLSKKLGEGQFGEVYKAELKVSKERSLDVAVKLVKKGSPTEEMTKLLQEAATLGQFKHRHVVRLIGVVIIEEPKMMLMELLPGGDLKDYVDSVNNNPSQLSSPDLPSLLLQFCKQVVDGLACLSRKSFVHRDIAARNILLDEDLNCKISDFGMTRDLEDDNYYALKKGSKIPLKWTAPETIFYKKYSTNSDVWSYGMLMYEIWSLGHKPFEDVDTQEMIQLLQRKYCLPPPPGCPRAVYEVMVKCWNYTPKDRPSAGDILGEFCKSERLLLSWKEADVVSSRSKVLGDPLSEGRGLYRDLQCKYISK